jgi:hypothetical protein
MILCSASPVSGLISSPSTGNSYTYLCSLTAADKSHMLLQATNNGGAIQQLGGNITIASSSFVGNTAGAIGGGYFGSDVVRPRACSEH